MTQTLADELEALAAKVSDATEGLDHQAAWDALGNHMVENHGAILTALRAREVSEELATALAPFAKVGDIPAEVPGVTITDQHIVTAEVPYARHEQISARSVGGGTGTPMALNVSLDALCVGDFRKARAALRAMENNDAG